MTEEEIFSLVNKVKSSVETPYPETVSLPAENTGFDNLTNFLRDTPRRKVFLFSLTGGDYDYDESMNIDVEIDMDIANDNLFSSIIPVADSVFGKYEGEFPADLPNIIETNGEDTSRDNEQVDGFSWTPEYEGGAIFRNTDAYDLRYWLLDKNFICLQKGKWTGDGNFLLYVVITISPLK